jgi:site-specific recombinase XerD
MRKGDHLDRRADRMTEQAVWVAVKRYDKPLGLDIAPHELRRTFANLALKGQARLE